MYYSDIQVHELKELIIYINNEGGDKVKEIPHIGHNVSKPFKGWIERWHPQFRYTLKDFDFEFPELKKYIQLIRDIHTKIQLYITH